MHQSFTDAVVKWFFDNFPMSAKSFSVVSIHCVARGLGASFLNSVPHHAVVPGDSTAFLFWHRYRNILDARMRMEVHPREERETLTAGILCETPRIMILTEKPRRERLFYAVVS